MNHWAAHCRVELVQFALWKKGNLAGGLQPFWPNELQQRVEIAQDRARPLFVDHQTAQRPLRRIGHHHLSRHRIELDIQHGNTPLLRTAFQPPYLYVVRRTGGIIETTGRPGGGAVCVLAARHFGNAGLLSLKVPHDGRPAPLDTSPIES